MVSKSTSLAALVEFEDSERSVPVPAPVPVPLAPTLFAGCVALLRDCNMLIGLRPAHPSTAVAIVRRGASEQDSVVSLGFLTKTEDTRSTSSSTAAPSPGTPMSVLAACASSSDVAEEWWLPDARGGLPEAVARRSAPSRAELLHEAPPRPESLPEARLRPMVRSLTKSSLSTTRMPEMPGGIRRMKMPSVSRWKMTAITGGRTQSHRRSNTAEAERGVVRAVCKETARWEGLEFDAPSRAEPRLHVGA